MSSRRPPFSVRVWARMRSAFALGVLTALVAIAASCSTHSATVGHSPSGTPAPLALPLVTEATTGHAPVAPSPSCPPDSRSPRIRPAEQAPSAPTTRTAEGHPSPPDEMAVQDLRGSPPTAHGTRTGRLTLLRISRWRI